MRYYLELLQLPIEQIISREILPEWWIEQIKLSGGSSAATVQFGGVVGGTTPVGAIIITGNLDLNADILQSDNTAGATSVAVSGTSDLGADVKTTGNQTYTGNTTISADITLTGGAQLTVRTPRRILSSSDVVAVGIKKSSVKL